MERPWLYVVFKSESVAFPGYESLLKRAEVDYTQLVAGVTSFDAAVSTLIQSARTLGV